MPQTRYDSYDSGGEQYDNDPEIIFSTYATVEFDLSTVFGTENEYGQSLGVGFEDVELVDGCLYADLDKQKFKLFSWQGANDMSPAERYERDEEPEAADASDLIRKTYAGNEKEYELVAARVDEVLNEDGDVVVEPSTRVRDIEFTDDGADFSEWEDVGQEKVSVGDYISWFDAGDNGPSITSVELAEVLTEYGSEATVDEDDAFNWLTDVSADNVLRGDLKDRRLRMFIVSKQGDQYTYNLPIVEDVETDAQIQENNRTGGDSGNSNSPSESEAVQEAEAADEGDYPEPIADFIQSGNGLDLTESRAEKLLVDLIESEDNAMTAQMVDDYGGQDALVQKVV